MHLLSPFGWLYGRAASVRNAMYDRGVFTCHPLGARTISIGNITVGGTGKTPLVALTSQILAERGEKVCILTRGYGRKRPARRIVVSDGENVLANAETGGDEPVELAHRLLGKAVIIADADRVAAARWAAERFGVTVFVLDDAFQHRRAKRDLDIVCIDATDPFGGGKMLPAGRLREALKNLDRADAIVITRADMIDSTDEIAGKIRRLNSTAAILTASNSSLKIVRLDEFLRDKPIPDNENDLKAAAGAYLFCGIGNPDSLVAQFRRENFPVGGIRKFSDHHSYSQSDVIRLESDAAAAGCVSLLTTAKDAVKLAGLDLSMPLFVARSETEMSDLNAFTDLVTSS